MVCVLRTTFLMEIPKTRLEATKVAEFAAILRQERDTLALSELELVASRWLAILGLKVIPILIIVAVVLASIGLLLVKASMDFAVLPLLVAIVGTAALVFVAIVCLALTPFTVSIHVKALRQWWVVRRTGLTGQFQELWAEGRRDRRLGLRIIIAFVVSFILSALAIAGWKADSGKHLSEHLYYLFVVSVCLAPVIAWLAQRNRQRLEVLADVERLSNMLSRHASASSDDVVLPAAAVARIADIERAQIARDRVAALQEASSSGSSSGCAVVKSAATQAALRSLDLPTRLRVEDRIQELSAVPAPAPAPLDNGTSSHREHVGGTPCTLLYEIDRSAGRITIVDVEASRD